MEVSFTRISPTQHQLAYRPEGGLGETVVNETKSTLLHDLIHYSLETEAGLKHSFYGLLASGQTYAELSESEALTPGAATSEIAQTERIAGALHAVVAGKATPAGMLAALSNLFEAYGEPLPSYLDEALIARAAERAQGLLKRWEMTPAHFPLTLEFPEA